MNKKIWRISCLFLIPLAIWGAIIENRVSDECRISPSGKRSASGLAEHVKDSFEAKYGEENVSGILVLQRSCSVIFQGFVESDLFVANSTDDSPDTNDDIELNLNIESVDQIKEQDKKIKNELEQTAVEVTVETNPRTFKQLVRSVDSSQLNIIRSEDSYYISRELQNLHYDSSRNLQIVLDTLWLTLTGILVFFMNAGFAMLETGFCRRKNSITILAKNLVVFALTTLAFWGIGFAFMFGDGSPFIGWSGWLLFSPGENSPVTGELYEGVFKSISGVATPLNTKFFFQVTFASAAASIISGAVAERIKFKSFFLFVPLFVVFIYSIVGHWVWGNGLLSGEGKLIPGQFWDFAGSTVVHSVGGYAGLIGTLLLGPRLQKYQVVEDIQEFNRIGFINRTFPLTFDLQRGKIWRFYLTKKRFRICSFPNDINGNNASSQNKNLATLGCLILWLGWLGFNAGSTLEANQLAISHVLMNTVIAASAGSIGALVCAWIYFDKPSISFLINGVLAGCVSITAPCAFVSQPFAAIIGFIGGLIVLFATVGLDKLKIDDPVGAIPVHLVCGLWGTIAVGLFSEGSDVYPLYGLDSGPDLGLLLGGGFSGSFLPQIYGITIIGLFTMTMSLLLWIVVWLCSNKNLRISSEEEMVGGNIEFSDAD